MERREFVKLVPLTALGATVGGKLAVSAAIEPDPETIATSMRVKQKQEVPAYAGKLQHSDGAVMGSDGKQKTSFSDAGNANKRKDPKAPY